MASLWANQSCDPFRGRDAQCVIGTYVQYAVNASDVDQISKTVEFAKEKNIRFVIKNTGHELVRLPAFINSRADGFIPATSASRLELAPFRSGHIT